MIDSDNSENVIVGEEARKVWCRRPKMAAGRFKREMGTDKIYELDGRKWTPMDLSAKVLGSIKKDAEAALGKIAEAVVTIPANFSHEARSATLQAASKAGLDVKYIIDEPTAAALYYAYKEAGKLSGKYAVYDLGGGTFDVSIINIQGKDVDVITSHGVPKLGGDDFDQALIEMGGTKYQELTGEAMTDRQYDKELAEEDKKSLSDRSSVLAGAGRGVGDEDIKVTQKEFEAAIATMISQTEMLCEQALDDANIQASDLNGVFLVGGSTRVPAVKQCVTRVFGREPIESANVDEVVALGAALYAAYKSDGKHLSDIQKNAMQGVTLTEVTNKCFGSIICSLNATTGKEELQNSIIINRGEKRPCSAKHTYYTMYEDQQAIDCTVTESTATETDPRFVNEIGKKNLSLPPGRPADQPIEVTFAYDENQCMKCSFKDVESGKQITLDFDFSNSNQHSDDEDDIDKITIE
jgi:molecular chaperone DnaK